MSDCRFGISPVNYPDPDPDLSIEKSLSLHLSKDIFLGPDEWLMSSSRSQRFYRIIPNRIAENHPGFPPSQASPVYVL